jgi:hypothetical protein
MVVAVVAVVVAFKRKIPVLGIFVAQLWFVNN